MIINFSAKVMLFAGTAKYSNVSLRFATNVLFVHGHNAAEKAVGALRRAVGYISS